jgi:anti-sigma factor RsiW
MSSQDPCRTAFRARALGQLAGGELAPVQAALLEEHARGCASCGARLASLRAQRELLRASVEGRLSQVDLSGFTERVLAAVEADRAALPLSERARVVSLEQFRAHKLLTFAAGAAAACALFAFALRPALTSPDASLAPAGELVAQASIDFLETDGQAGVVIEAPGHTTVIFLRDEDER